MTRPHTTDEYIDEWKRMNHAPSETELVWTAAAFHLASLCWLTHHLTYLYGLTH